MPSFPFYRFPYSNYYQYCNTMKTYNNNEGLMPIKDDNEYNEKNNENNRSNNNEKTSRYNSFGPIKFQNPFEMNFEEPVLDILGIRLYLDDLIILGLLFLLYKEGVKDELLFLSLILLLIS